MVQGRVLVVDDEMLVRWSVERTLSQRGHEVLSAGSGEEALKLVEDRVFDVIVTDLRMPGIDGLTLACKAKAALPNAAIIVITAHGLRDVEVQAARQGIFALMEKPLDLAEVAGLVESALESPPPSLTSR